eukprot:scaffold7173_cov81-Skeletonema_dohrnii-CCMP3373.AAC.1
MILDLLQDIIKATNEMKKPGTGPLASQFSHDTDVAAGQLIYLYEQLILAPTNKTGSSSSLTQLIKRRIHMFRAGKLEELYAESRTVTSRSVQSQAQSSTPTTNQQHPSDYIKRSAQRAADADDFRTATARLLKSTPIAPNTPDNIQICQELHPPCLEYEPQFPSIPQTRSQANPSLVKFSAEEVVQRIRDLSTGKASGIQGDSIDPFIKLIKKRIPSNANLKTLPQSSIAHDLATFFSNIANANYGRRERNIINTIYFVAFHKDTNNPKKLRPIGVPTATRRITANLLMRKNRDDFASYLLPYNYAVGVQGGITTVVNTLRLGVEKYITNPEAQGSLPTRALVSLDIRNMFNAVSRHKLREIIAHEFPHLQKFTDSLYQDYHTAMFKNSENEWEQFTVEEGFTQGCPLSPIFAGIIVLTHILKQIDKELQQRAATRLSQNNAGDDGNGGLPIIMAYVDDTNCLLPIEDVNFFLERFEHYGVPLGAVMNTDKTRIMTSTSGQSILPQLLQQQPINSATLTNAITKYSNKNSQMHEEVNGLRVLGSPIGSDDFQAKFIEDYLSNAQQDAANLLCGLEDDQTILQLYRQCTTQRLNHLFPADVYAHATNSNCPPSRWHQWDSPTTKAFDELNKNVILAITQKETMPIHSQLLTNIDTKRGGIGITSPRLKAIPSFILATKTTLDTIYNGVNLGKHRKRYMLPQPITSLYEDHTNNPSKLLQLFNKFGPEIATICTKQDSNQMEPFINSTKLNTCHERINTSLADRLTEDVIFNLDQDSKHNIEEILDGKFGQGLLDLPRKDQNNRQPNNLFRYNLLRCLRINIWENNDANLICPLCKQDFDKKGDHLYQCSVIGKKIKTKMHDQWNSSWCEYMNRLMPLVRLADSKAMKEQTCLVKKLRGSRVRPFDSHINLPTISNDGHFRCRLNNIGFDIILCNSDTCPPPSRGG